MSLITRCPACQTLFKIVRDQLRISDGWVRCGQCDEIFDASLHLLQASPAATPQPVDSDPADDDTERSSPEPIQDKFSPLDASLPALPAHVADVAGADPDDADPVSRAELSDVSFLRDQSPGSFWYKPLMHATLVLLSLALLLGLAGQIVFHERDRIVASEPGLKPWLLAFCSLLNCTLLPLRRIESIVIDSSSFARIRGNSYHLDFTLKNTAVTALAVPAIELTLTDSLDQPVIRRVFPAIELGVKLDTLAAGSEWPASLAMAVTAAATADRIVGYRLLAFYP